MDWKAIVGTVAPWIATAATGPLGGMAVSAIADALGVSDKTEEAIKQAITGATPEQMLALKKADQEFAIKMKELGFAEMKDMEALAVQDRDSARKRETSVKDNTNKVLAYIVVLSFVAVVGFTLAGMAKAESVLAGTLIGYLSAKAEQVLAYYFGSTSGSKAKTELLAKANPVKD